MSEEYRVSYRLGLVCPDCGADMDDSYDEGDVCEKCWDGYGGLDQGTPSRDLDDEVPF